MHCGLTGPRQVGKTALLERTFPRFNYVSLDLASVAEFAETRPQEFLAQHPPPVLIDEVQYAPALFRNIKRCGLRA
jgi:predicted AAA+ superfamily ATPase